MAKANPFKDAVVLPQKDWFVEEPALNFVDPFLQIVSLEYSDGFAQEFHANYLILEEGKPRGVLSIIPTAVPKSTPVTKEFDLGFSFKALFTDEKGAELFQFHNVPISSDRELIDNFTSFITSRLFEKNLEIYSISLHHFASDFLKFELRFSRRIAAFKVAVLCAKGNQSDMSEIFGNRPDPTSPFFVFMNSIATKVDMSDYEGYRGDMGKTGEDAATLTYATKWNDVEIIFHVAPAMNGEQHRRLCGNDIGVIVFHEPGTTKKSYEPFGSTAMGTVPHIFAVVQRTDEARESYRFSPEELKEFLFAKLYNGFLRANATPPLDRLFRVPRREALREFITSKLETATKAWGSNGNSKHDGIGKTLSALQIKH